MIPAPIGLVASYKLEGVDQHGKNCRRWEHKQVIAFRDDGMPMIFADGWGRDRCLVPASSYKNYDGIMEDPSPRIVSIMPAGGWCIAWKNDGRPERTEPLIGWGLRTDGSVVPLETDGSGFVMEVDDGQFEKYRIYHPEVENG